MRLFHVSEEPDIEIFNPRIPERNDMDKSVALVWAVDEERLPNYLVPRNCPRVTYHIGAKTTEEDKMKYFSSQGISHVVIIEEKWLEIMKNTVLYLYGFNSENFVLQDDIAGYYVSKMPQIPTAKYKIDDLHKALSERNIELRTVENLWTVSDEIQNTTLNWSMCRIKYAENRL